MSRHKSLNPMTRRDALRRIGNGFGMMAFASLVGRSLAYAQGVTTPDGTGGAATLDYPQRVKRVIFLFMNGGCSTIDCFDPETRARKIRWPAAAWRFDQYRAPYGRTDEIAVQIQEVWRMRHGCQ